MPFEKKFGWAELLATIAVLVSLAALWYARAQVTQNLPEVSVETQTAIRVSGSEPGDQAQWVALIPFVITNRGGRTVTLLNLDKADLPSVLRVVDGKITENHELDVSFAVIEGNVKGRDFIRSKALTVETQPLLLPELVNESIESGKARSFVLVLRMIDKKNRPINGSKIYFSCNAVFGDGTKHRIAQAFGYM